jgi:hypothetical protein
MGTLFDNGPVLDAVRMGCIAQRAQGLAEVQRRRVDRRDHNRLRAAGRDRKCCLQQATRLCRAPERVFEQLGELGVAVGNVRVPLRQCLNDLGQAGERYVDGSALRPRVRAVRHVFRPLAARLRRDDDDSSAEPSRAEPSATCTGCLPRTRSTSVSLELTTVGVRSRLTERSTSTVTMQCEREDIMLRDVDATWRRLLPSLTCAFAQRRTGQ